MLLPSTFNFLATLKENNDREWFQINKAAYQQELDLIEAFADELLTGLNIHDVIETPSGKKSLYRIYRDTRFSKDKTPYRTYWSGSFTRAGKSRRGGYYFHIEHGNTFVGGGFWGPSAPDLKRVRDEIAFDAMPLRAILNSNIFISTFETLRGEQLKTAPKGFDAAHPDIDLLRYKQFLLIKKFTDEEAIHESFVVEAGMAFKQMRPFFDYMSAVLTSDSNGLEI